MGNTEFKIKPLQISILDIFKAFSRICDDNGFRYYAAYGTCLGAVRHKGFIPWDDDFDVAMPREDYERFRVVANDVLPARYKYCDWHNTKELFPAVYAKIQDSDKESVLAVEQQIGRTLPHGVYIDIFPLDGVPATRLARFMWVLKYQALKASSSSFQGITSKRRIKSILWRTIGAIINKLVFHARTRFDLAKYYDGLSKTYTYGNGMVGCVISPYGALRDLAPIEAFGESKKVPFEDVLISVPVCCDRYLRAIYGDYMVLPPIDKRRPTHDKLPEAPWKFGATEIKQSHDRE